MKIFAISVVLGIASFGGQSELFAQDTAPKILSLPAFHSIELPSFGHVVLRSGSTQHVTLVKGSLIYSSLRVNGAGVLVVEKCRRTCPRDYQLEVEIELPSVAMLSVNDGGWIRARGTFPQQDAIELAASNGATIDARSIPVDRVTATVDQGGTIFTAARVSLDATVTHGGEIVYWGGARVTQSIEDGGSVEKGVLSTR